MGRSERSFAAVLLAGFIIIRLLMEQPASAVDVTLVPVQNLPMIVLVSTPGATGTPTPTPTPLNHWGGVLVTGIKYESAGPQERGEYVEIANTDIFNKYLRDWTLRDNANHVYTFPSFIMSPGQICRIYTNQWQAKYCNFNFQSETGIWDDGGDCAYLRDSSGALVSSYCY